MRIDIWSDVVCPFCYLGKQRLNQALSTWSHAGAVDIVWHSFELDPGAPAQLDEGLAEHIATKYRTSLSQAEAAQAGIAEQFAATGLTFDWRSARPGNTFNAHRVFHLAVEHGLGEQVMAALMRGYFSEGAAIGDPQTVAGLAISAGLDADDVRRVLESDAYADDVRADEATAREIGITGVPFFVLDGRLAVSGAQPVEVFTQALNQAWDTREVPLVTFAGADDAEACGPDGCPIDGAPQDSRTGEVPLSR